MHKCKYCGENIGIVVPEPLTCWNCYKKLRDESNIIIDPLNDKNIYKGEDVATKKCEMCGRTLHLSNFSKTGNSLHKYCKECVIKDYSQKFLGTLKTTQIRKIAQSGIKSTNLSDVCDKQHSTCMQYFNNLVKAGYGYKREINGVITFFIKKDVAKKFIEHKEIDDISKIVAKVNKTKNSREIKKNPSKGIIKFTAEDVETKKCEMCGKILPVSNFYRTGNTHLKNCKECMVKDKAQKCLNNLNVRLIRKMSKSGITARVLSKEWNKTRSTTQHNLSDLIKAGYGYKKEINGVHTYFLDKNHAEKLITDFNSKTDNETQAIVKKPLISSKVLLNSKKTKERLKTNNEPTKKCEMCNKTLPLSNFYKSGNTHFKLCKECVIIDSAQKFLDTLNIVQIEKMAQSGIKSTNLSSVCKKRHSTCLQYLNNLIKSGYGYKREINGINTFLIKEDVAKKLVAQKKIEERSKIATKVKKPKTAIEVIKKPKKDNFKSEDRKITTKKCVVCKKILPIDEFYKMGNSRNKMCKSCVRDDTSRRCLESLSNPQIIKMSNSGVTTEYLAKEWGRTRSTCKSMLASLVKTGDAYKKVINGKSTYFMDKKKAENLLKQKVSQKNQYSSNKKINENPLSEIQSSHAATVPIISDLSSEGMVLEKMPNKGLLIKNLDIHHLGSIIQDIRSIDPDFNFEILTKGNKSQIFLSEDLLLRFAYKNIGNVLKNY